MTAGALAVAVVATAVAVGALTRGETGAGPPRVLTHELTLGLGTARLQTDAAAISGDGRRIAHVAIDQRGVYSLYVRDVTEAVARPLPGTEGVRRVAFSNTNDEVAFTRVSLGPLTIVPLDGAPARVLAEDAQAWPVWGEGHVYFVNAELGISRVPIEGGAVERVTPVTEDGLVRVPSDVLPGEEVVLFTEFDGGSEAASVRVLSMDSGEMTTLTRGFGGVVRDGVLVYAAESQDRLMGVAFDPETLEVSGDAVMVVAGVASAGSLFGGAVFNVSRSGDLIHAPAGLIGDGRVRPVWVDRSGNVTTVPADWWISPVNSVSGLALSHDGTQLAVASGGAGQNDVELFVNDLRGGPLRRLSFEAPVSTRPFWSPDDREVFYFQDVTGSFLEGDLVARRADGSGGARTIVPSVGIGEGSWSRDGAWMIYRVGVPARRSRDIFALPAGAEASESIELVATDAVEQDPSLSPDGRWLLYQSNRSGQHEVYVRPFPRVGDGLQQISLAGGTEPRWAHSGREIFYKDEQARMVAVPVEAGSSRLEVGSHEVLFDASPFWSDPASPQYGVAPDDQRFLMLRGEGTGRWGLVATWNWIEQAKARVEETNR